jgi:hypothetical protein
MHQTAGVNSDTLTGFMNELYYGDNLTVLRGRSTMKALI